MTREEREDALNCFKNKLENEVFGAKYNKLALEALEQASILDKIRAEMFEEMLSHSGTGEEVIQAYADGLKKGLDILDKYNTEVEITPQFSSGLDKELEKDFGESDCIIRDSAIKALDYDIKCFEFKPGVSKHMDDIAKLLNTIYEIQVNNIKDLPSVTPQKPRWIPTSERLPEEHNGYLVSMKQGYVTTALWVGNAGYWNEVTAWMPLPESYKAESEDKE